MMEKLTLHLTRMIPLLLCSLFLFASCSASPSLPDYRLHAFDAEFFYFTETSQLGVSAHVASPRAEGDSLPRDVILTFSFPKAMQGLVITRQDGKISMDFEGIHTEGISETPLLRCVDLLIMQGPLTIIGPCERSGISFVSATIQNEKDNAFYEVYLAPNTGYPKEIIAPNEHLQIQSFQSLLSPT